MRLTFTFLMLCAIFSTAFGQINEESPFPLDLVVTSPAAATGVYDYGSMVTDGGANPIWGPQVTEDLSGEIVWAFNQVDSLGCPEFDDMGNLIGGPILNDVMGKIALVRRGACAFSAKVRSVQAAGAIACLIVNHYDDDTQNSNTLVGMLGTPPADDITIPAAFISRLTGEIITAELDAGNPVEILFDVKSFYDPIGSYSYNTPLSDALDVDVFRINYVNPSPTDNVDINVTATITDPAGVETVLTGTSNVAPLSDSIVGMDQTYTPSMLGDYTVVYSNDQNEETASTSFSMTDYTYSLDNGNISGFAVGPSETQFAEANLVYQVGSLVVVDEDGAVATHASFGLGNADEIFTGDADADAITVILYDADADEDGEIDFPSDATAFAAARFDDLSAVALASYVLTGEEEADELIYVELEDLLDGDGFIDLKPDGAYYITVSYDGSSAGLGVAPQFTASETVSYVNFPSTPLLLDQMYTGWGSRTVSVGLHLDGFVINTNLLELAANTVTIAPNPVQDRMNVRLEFEEVVDEVNLRLLDVTGKLIYTSQYDNMLEGNVEIDTENLPSGTYFLSIETPTGYRAEKVVKL